MKLFPRIYSISTVGLIFHYNRDYLIHPLRTDFNGESGIGKSLIADLLQLIFVGKRGNKYYKPGTESSGSTGRGTESLPLDSIGYAFINIQKSEKLFLTIGVYIQKNTGSVTPFIIQKGIQWDKNSSFEYHDKILLHEDFITRENAIAELEVLRKTILKPKGFILEAFQPADISRYHNLLYVNQILPIDLSQDDDKLITYAQIIQSFARAKTLNLDKKEFKNFLFADDEEIYEEYKNQIRALEEYQRQYLDQRRTISKVGARFEVLKAYKDALALKEKAFIAYLTARAAFDFQQYDLAKKEHLLNRKQYANNLTSIQYFYLLINEFEEQQLQLQLNEHLDSEKNCKGEANGNNLKLKEATEELEKVVAETSVLETSLFNLRQINETIDKFEELISKYGSVGKIEAEIEFQPVAKINKKKLEDFILALRESDSYSRFESSYFITSEYESSFEKSLGDVQRLNQEIQEYDTLIEAYASNSSSSIISWVLSQADRAFTIAEESVLRHFIKLSTEKPSPGSVERRYIPSPEALLKNLKVITDGEKSFWINLDGVVEEVVYVIDPSFSGSQSMNIESILNTLNAEVSAKRKERDDIDSLKKSLQKAAWSADLLNLFRNKDTILGFKEDSSLPTRSQLDHMKSVSERKSEHREKLKEVTEAFKLNRNKESELKTTIQQCNEMKIQLDRMLTELTSKIAASDQKIKAKGLDIQIRKEKLRGIQIDHSDFINATTIDNISLRVNKEIKPFIKANVIDSSTIFQDKVAPLEASNGTIIEKIKVLEDPDHIHGLTMRASRYTTSKDNYYRERGIEFNPAENPGNYTEESVKASENTYESAERKVNEIHDNQLQQLLPENETIGASYDLETVARELLPKVFEGKQIVSFENNLETEVTGYLTSINESMRQIDDHKLKLIQGIFNKVYSVYDEYDDKIKDIRSFFEEKEITGGMKVKVDFLPSKHYPIEWIQSLKKQISSQSIKFAPLFKESDDEEISAEEIIIRTFKQHSDSKVKDPDIHKLTNPKSYFDVEVNLIRPSGEKSDGSSGQDYAKIALLCIARLSRIERDKRLRKAKIIPGIRFMPIDEVAGLGGNFELLYQIAQEYDYQILTMTISPDIVFEEGKQFVYILHGDKETNEKKINMPPFGLFSQDDLQENIAPFIKAQTDEKRINVEDHR